MNADTTYRLADDAQLHTEAGIAHDRGAMFWDLVNLATTQIRDVADFKKWCAVADTVLGRGFRYTDDGIAGGIDQTDENFESAVISQYKMRFADFSDATPVFAHHARAMCIALGQWDADDQTRFEEDMSMNPDAWQAIY